MTILECTAPRAPILGRAKGSLVVLLVFATLVVAAYWLPARAAEGVLPGVPAAKVDPPSAKPSRSVVDAAHATKQAGAKPKPRPRGAPKAAKPTPASAAKPTPASAAEPTATVTAKPTAASAAEPTQVMDFNTDEIEGQRLEPGLDLIQAPLRRARHPSMVPSSPKPEDSVVRGN